MSSSQSNGMKSITISVFASAFITASALVIYDQAFRTHTTPVPACDSQASISLVRQAAGRTFVQRGVGVNAAKQGGTDVEKLTPAQAQQLNVQVAQSLKYIVENVRENGKNEETGGNNCAADLRITSSEDSPISTFPITYTVTPTISGSVEGL